MRTTAQFKVDRATAHVNQLNENLAKSRPFFWVIQTTRNAQERLIYPKTDTTEVNDIALLIGDAVHNLRSALDHAFWQIVSPACQDVSINQLRRIQFPFSREANRLDRRIQEVFGHRAGTGFYSAVRSLKPHGEAGGNELLYLTEELDILDKHKLLIPTSHATPEFTRLLRQEVPDFPFNFQAASVGNGIAMVWQVTSPLSRNQLGSERVPGSGVFNRELKFPVNVSIEVGPNRPSRPLIPMLNMLVDAVGEAIRIMEVGADSA